MTSYLIQLKNQVQFINCFNHAMTSSNLNQNSSASEKIDQETSAENLTPTEENAESEQTTTDEMSAPDTTEDSEHQHLAAVTSPAELLTSELLRVELVAPIPTPEQTPPLANEDEESATEATPLTSKIDETIKTEEAPQETLPLTEESKVLTTEAASTTTSPLQTLKMLITHPSVLMVLSAFLFATMILFVKLASPYYTSFEIISARGVIGALFILFFQQIKLGVTNGILSVKTSHLPMQAWRAFIGTMSMICWFYGISKLSLAMATTLSYMSSIWIAIFIISTAFINGSTRPSAKLIFAILLGFGGILLILRPSGTDIDMFAAAVVVISSIFAALAYLQVAALGRVGEPAYRTVFYFSFFGIFFGLIGTLVTQGHFSAFSATGAIFVVFIGLLAVLAQLCLTLAYTKGSALVNASLQYSGLVFVIFFDWVLGLQWPDYVTWLGMALVVVSGLLATILRAKQA